MRTSTSDGNNATGVNTLQTFTYIYDGNSVSFKKGTDEAMINATEMAKPFGKTPKDFLRTQQAKTFIAAIGTARHISLPTELVSVVNGGSDYGTWMHEDVALEFARWLSPAFSIWCNDRIKELMRHGATAVNPDDLYNPDFIIGLAQKLKEERAANDSLRAINELQERELKESAHKATYHDKVLQSVTGIPITIIAKELGTSAVLLNRELHSRKIQYRQGETWVLTAPYLKFGFTVTKTHTYADSHGNERTDIHTYWTEKGRKFIHGVIHMESGHEYRYAQSL